MIGIAGAVSGEDRGKLASEAWKILEKRCFACHGEEAKAGLRLDRRELGDDDLVVWGRPQESRLWLMINGQGREIMPPTGKLPKAERAAIKRWIEKGRP